MEILKVLGLNKVYGKENNKVIAAIRKIHPDFIVVAGDVITSTPGEDITAGVALLNALSREYHIYYGLGNHESKIKRIPSGLVINFNSTDRR